MAWYESASFYHIYPLGLTGAPARNAYDAPQPRLRSLLSWVDYLADMGFTALYIGPLFESVGHGYETTDYRRLDSRLGTNEDLRDFVAHCHQRGVRVILDAVFNHTGRDFFAFRGLLQNRERSRYRDWYSGVNFFADNGYHDGLRYDTWGGYELLAKLNLTNPEVRQYHLETVRFWVRTFDIDGLRLDAADVLDFGFLAELRALADTVKPEFWLMGEVIHGDYTRWVNGGMLHSVTNYRLQKALYSSHNDRNYFELAHTVEQLGSLCNRLYSFVDNHDVERIRTRLRCRADELPVHVLLFTLPGIPSVYYGSELGVEGRKVPGSDAGLRPALSLPDPNTECPLRELIRALARLRQREPALQFGSYRRLSLTTGAFAFSRTLAGRQVIVAVNNADEPARLCPEAELEVYVSPLSGSRRQRENGRICLELPPHGAEILVPEGEAGDGIRAVVEALREAGNAGPASEAESGKPLPAPPPSGKPLEEMSVEELQGLILEKLGRNGPVTDRMRREVSENVYPDSLRNWARSFR